MADDRLAGRLVCAECGTQADDGAEGWRAYLTSDEPEEVATFCPDCAECEFGGGSRARSGEGDD